MARSTKRITQNAVMIVVLANSPFFGRIVVPHDGPIVTVDGKEKQCIDLKTADGQLVETVQPGTFSTVAEYLPIYDVQDALDFLAGHNILPAKAKSGYDSYFSGQGPINNQTPRTLDVTGLARNILVFTQALHEKQAKGGDEGAAATSALAIIDEYNLIAAEQIATQQQADSETAFIAQATAVGISPEQIKTLLAQRNTPAPEATVEASEAADTTGGELEAPAVIGQIRPRDANGHFIKSTALAETPA